ncbi:hypothetical protein [Kitasatospora sp. NPDC091207]|uniref:hypothetical protein n=1 Tax=Kitasatospora sp. NPDC091207 TaxID=3364083 RepID=UPI003828CCF3
MATNTATKTLCVASVLVGFAAATVVCRTAADSATAKSVPAPEAGGTGKRCKPGERDCKR